MTHKFEKTIKYTIFQTKWGYFGLVGTGTCLLRTHLPLADRRKVKSQLLSSIQHPVSSAEYNQNLFYPLQKQIKAYFQGKLMEPFIKIPLLLDGLSPFSISILKACSNIRFGKTAIYKQLAIRAGHPKASRAVGNALAKNPLPLIIPCHRVIRCDGQIGGFSVPGGIKTKQKMLQLESPLQF